MPPVTEPKSPDKYPLEESHSYLVRDSTTAILAFCELGLSGRQTLLISSASADFVRREFDPQPNVLWLISDSTEKNAIAGEDLLTISLKVKDFLDSGERRVVLVQGIDTLLEYNGFSPVLRLIQGLNEAIATKRGIMLLYVPADSLGTKEEALLVSETTAMPAPS